MSIVFLLQIINFFLDVDTIKMLLTHLPYKKLRKRKIELKCVFFWTNSNKAIVCSVYNCKSNLK